MLTPRQTSPYNLMQERYRENPWALLVGCILFNMVHGKKAEPVHAEFLRRWPTPNSIGLYRVETPDGPIIGDWAPAAGQKFKEEMCRLFQPIGFQYRRVERIYKMTADFLELEPAKNPGVDIRELHGCGKYAADSFNMFVRGQLVEDVGDKELKKYVRWAQDLYSGKTCVTLSNTTAAPKEGTT